MDEIPAGIRAIQVFFTQDRGRQIADAGIRALSVAEREEMKRLVEAELARLSGQVINSEIPAPPSAA